jgi:glycosyltransferase involved in cell wall biosynthesis
VGAGISALSAAEGIAGSHPVVGIAYPEPIHEHTWSGVPAGLTRGLRACGVEVVHLTGTSDGGTAMRSPAVAERTGEEIRRAVEAAGPLDGIVQMGSTFTLPAGVRYVTFEDVTVAQALAKLDLPEDWARAWRRRQEEAYSRAVACCVASTWAAHSVREDYGVSPERVRVVGFGANLELGAGAPAPYDPPRFLFVGRGWERKNGPSVLRAFGAVHREFPAATLELVSEHPEIDRPGVHGHGPLRPLPDRDGEAARRLFLGRLFERATCFVVPSRFEPFGIAYVEAGAAGVASIGTSVGGAGTAIGGGGLLVDPDDEAALLDAMRRLCDPETARRLGSIAKRNAAHYTWARVAERVLEALRGE